MNYTECLDYLYAKLPMFSRSGPAALKMDLSNTISICNALNNPEKKFRCIHVAGTNGKGSVSHMIAAVCQASGFKTGLYTSPHLVDFRERIRINGQMIPEKRVIAFTESMIPLIDTIAPSFFELTVGLAFQYFAEHEVDIAVIETGLGGRLDSTNVVTPLLSIITTIGFDHVALLGNTLEKIAFEKAGILKSGVPALIGEKAAATEAVFRSVAAKKQTDLYFAENLAKISTFNQEIDKLEVEIEDLRSLKKVRLQTDLAGIYQKENLRTVYAAFQILREKGLLITEDAMASGLNQVIQLTGLHGRWELLQKKPNIVADVAHNPDGIKKLISQLSSVKHNNLYIILGMSADKDVETILTMLPASAQYLFTQASIPRAMNMLDLKNLAESHGLKGSIAANVNEAIDTFKQKASDEDLILICGSVFIVGEIDRTKISQY